LSASGGIADVAGLAAGSTQSRMTRSGRGSTNIPATTLSFNMVASFRGTVGSGAYIEVVTESDERLA